MAWSRKEQPSPFDTTPITGLFFLDSDLLARKLKIDWTKGEKSPMIAFPSGIACELWETSEKGNGIVHLYGEMDLSLRDTRDSAYTHAASIAEEVGYLARKVRDNQLEVLGHDRGEHLLITYDNIARYMVNVAPIRSEGPPPHPPLLDETSRQKLPPLYSGEKLGLNALAQVKFFTPDSNWTWYASEFDGTDLFFGLVIGDEIELGSFSLAELEQIRGPLHLPIERDRWFTPQTLNALQEAHRQQRGGQ